jgi:hypothetical protein
MRDSGKLPQTAVQVRLTPPILELFENWRRTQPGKIPPRSAAARELLAWALQAERRRENSAA